MLYICTCTEIRILYIHTIYYVKAMLNVCTCTCTEIRILYIHTIYYVCMYACCATGFHMYILNT